LKEKNIFDDETSAFVKEVIAMLGALTLPSRMNGWILKCTNTRMVVVLVQKI